MIFSNLRSSLLALSLAAVACDAEEPAFGAGDVDERCTGCGGIKLNTNKIGKHYFSEIDTLGDKWDGVALEGVKLAIRGGIKLDKVWAENGQLIGTSDGVYYSGLSFQGAEFFLYFEAEEDVWTQARMVVTHVGYDPSYGWKYRFAHEYLGGPKELYPNCDEDTTAANGAEFDAIVTGDITVDTKSGVVEKRENTLFIGCLSGGVGKAGAWGYPRHKLASLEEFTGIVRMVRADYCATGDSFTEVGQELTMLDKYGYNNLVPSKLESIWTEDGAACVYRPRLESRWPSAADVIAECEALGGKIPAECDGSETLASVPGALALSANPS